MKTKSETKPAASATKTETLCIPFGPGEIDDLRKVAAECDEPLEQFARSILLSTRAVPPLGHGPAPTRPPSDASNGTVTYSNGAGAGAASGAASGGLIIADANPAVSVCDRCGREVVRAKSQVSPRHYMALRSEVDWNAKPHPIAKRHMCVG